MNVKTDKLGIPVFTFDNLFDVIYCGYAETISNLQCEDSEELQKFNKSARIFSERELVTYKPMDTCVTEFDKVLQKDWFVPESYQNLDIEEYLLNRCESDIGKHRVTEELCEYKKRNMFPVLKLMVFLIDFMKEHSIVWGVGRGSSVSSYVLYLLGVHKIDSIKHGLDFKEFLRDEE